MSTNATTFDKQLQAIRRSHKLLVILILLFTVVVFWTFTSIISSNKQPITDTELIRLATPLNPVLQVEALDSLENKRKFSSEELSTFPIYKIIVSQSGREESVVAIETTVEELEARLQQTQPGAITPLPVVDDSAFYFDDYNEQFEEDFTVFDDFDDDEIL